MRVCAILVEDENLAVLHVTHVLGADDVERTGLGGKDGAAVQFAEHQRPDAKRIAGADQFLVGESDEGVGPFEHA